jgi:hypothetical protein
MRNRIYALVSHILLVGLSYFEYILQLACCPVVCVEITTRQIEIDVCILVYKNI